MRSATGAMWIFGICLTFIIMMTAYLAISVNYAKAFRNKSYIVSMIEEHEGYSSTLDEAIELHLDSEGYNARGTCSETISSLGTDEDWEFQTCINKDETGKCSACIYKTTPANAKVGPTTRARYRVITFFKFDIPVVRSLLTFPVAGESRYIFNFAV